MGQYTKLKQRFASTIEEITTVAKDGKQRVMICSYQLLRKSQWLQMMENPLSPLSCRWLQLSQR